MQIGQQGVPEQIDQLNPNRFVSLLPSLRKTMLNFTDLAAIREPKTSSIFGTFVRVRSAYIHFGGFSN
jgi:hypothetical protein